MLVVNTVMSPLFDERERAALLVPRDLDRNSPGDEAIACGIRRAIRERVQATSMSRLAEVPGPHVELPLLLTDAATPAAVEHLASYF
jgi:hypothetical protein